ncbi:LuxR C-terminal-related transcriptional regulator [Dactylosporangium sp. NPDC049140]|uniref:helix-turn-helix transcriptional regulator n=1 Tax=Dactylosporangium sp. NPDC049140 TaxID=3155647 RepID=UPI0033F90F31
MVELLGRTDELDQIAMLPAAPMPAVPGLLWRGEPGIGKTALLSAAAVRAEAAGIRVLRAGGAPSEADVDFSAVHQLLYPLRGRIARSSGDRNDVLRRVLDPSRTGSPDPLAVSSALLDLLDDVAAERPLLLVVDDVAWLDAASARAFGFIARRLAGTRIAFVAAVRTGDAAPFDGAGLPEREIGPLAGPAAAALLDARHPELAPQVRRRLLDEAAGNPLALTELPMALTAPQRRAQEPPPTFLPLTARLESAFAPSLERLAAHARRLLLLAALGAGAGSAELLDAAPGGADFDDVASARRAGLLVADPVGRLSFRPPIVRSAVVQMSSPADRRDAHRALAARAADASRRAWHLAEAAPGPDESAANGLEQAFLSEFRSGKAVAAVTALVRAADLSPRASDRARRLIEAAFLASSTGPLDWVPEMLAEARRVYEARSESDACSGSVFAAATAVYLLNADGDVDGAHRLLSRALEDAAGGATSRWIDDLRSALLFVCIYAARADFWELLRDALDRLVPAPAPPLRLCYDAFTYPAQTFSTVREGVDRAFAAVPGETPSRWLIPLAFAALRLDVLSDYRHVCRRMIEEERHGGSVAAVLAGLLLLSADAFNCGRWDDSEALAHEGLDLARACGYHLLKAQLRVRLAFIAAGRGDARLASALTDEVTSWAAPRGLGMTQAFARHARVIASLAEGDYEDAYAQARWISRPDVPGTGIPARWVLLDLVEADIYSGRAEQARTHVAEAERAGLSQASPRTALIAAGAAALATDDGTTRARFEAALSRPGAERWPWEQARIHFAYGQWLRRTRDTATARLHLRAAVDGFERLGAHPWTRRARHELRATGVPTAPAGPRQATLTAQERQIAELAATGMTNKQIGERMFLSHRTVGAHLHRLFPKLGISSRAALRDALESLARSEHGPAR